MGVDITASFRIENAYEDGEEVVTFATDVVLPSPPADEESQEYSDWAYEHVHPLTGTGRTDGDAWYDVEVVACSVPELVGRTFDFGY